MKRKPDLIKLTVKLDRPMYNEMMDQIRDGEQRSTFIRSGILAEIIRRKLMKNNDELMNGKE